MYKTVFWKSLLFVCVFAFPVFGQVAKEGRAELSRGPSNAKVTLEAYVDYSCPTCANFNLNLRYMLKAFPSDVKIIFRHFPLQIKGHENSMSAARAVEAAGRQGKFWEMSDLIFEKQKLWTIKNSPIDDFVVYAKELKLKIKKFRADMESADVNARINADILRGGSLKINATPSVFLNGRQLTFDEILRMEDLKKVIAENIKSQSN